jgi:hypothetical protein
MDLLNAKNKFNIDFACAGAIEFTQEDALPGPERNLTAFDRDDNAGAHQARHEVTGAIPFTVRVIGLTAGDEPL